MIKQVTVTDLQRNAAKVISELESGPIIISQRGRPSAVIIDTQTFEQVERLGSLYGLLHSLVRQHIWLPIRARTGPQKGQLQWRRPSLATLAQVLHPPIYAGAYA